MGLVKLFLFLLNTILTLYDLVTFPIYWMLMPSWTQRTKQNLGQVSMPEMSSKSVTVTRQKGESKIYQEVIIDGKVDTAIKAFDFAVNKFKQVQCLGSREVLKEHSEMQNDGKVMKKLQLSDYKWKTYQEVQNKAKSFGRGLRKLLPKFKELLPHLPFIKTIIYMKDTHTESQPELKLKPIEIHTFDDLVTLGQSRPDILPNEPKSTDLAVLMYTSGSTGTPKGVMLTHKNLIATMQCLMFMIDNNDFVYMAYLPMAHVMELLSQLTMLLVGIKVGYSSPTTMTDMSPKIMKGCQGDATLLKPTVMCAVPLILDRLYKNITDNLEKKGPLFKEIFDNFYQYKLYWLKYGMETPLLDILLFKKIKGLLGGKMKWIMVGGAPLSQATHDFIRVCLGAFITQGYGLTESTCTGTLMENGDLSTGTVGKPMTGLHVKLIDWKEGNYNVTDRPNPRGEIVLGGNTICQGYFKMAQKTKEDFFMQDGIWWFKTGDIGELDHNDKLKIIDRKKDLVKLQHGEYVSLGKVEAQLKTHHLVENICVYGDSYKNCTVALVSSKTTHPDSGFDYFS
eukprot:01045.XXX_2991_4_1 [CDS] Oithona nana genome sequencing.